MLIRLEGVEKAYDLEQAAPVKALAGVDLEIAAGELRAPRHPIRRRILWRLRRR